MAQVTAVAQVGYIAPEFLDAMSAARKKKKKPTNAVFRIKGALEKRT